MQVQRIDQEDPWRAQCRKGRGLGWGSACHRRGFEIPLEAKLTHVVLRVHQLLTMQSKYPWSLAQEKYGAPAMDYSSICSPRPMGRGRYIVETIKGWLVRKVQQGREGWIEAACEGYRSTPQVYICMSGLAQRGGKDVLWCRDQWRRDRTVVGSVWQRVPSPGSQTRSEFHRESSIQSTSGPIRTEGHGLPFRIDHCETIVLYLHIESTYLSRWMFISSTRYRWVPNDTICRLQLSQTAKLH